MIIKRVGPVSCAKVAGTVYAIVGVAIGAAISLITWVGGFASSNAGAAGLGGAVGLASIIIFPILYGCIGFVATFLGAWLYNLVAGFVGGIEMEVQ
jgi:hypothetical protein